MRPIVTIVIFLQKKLSAVNRLIIGHGESDCQLVSNQSCALSSMDDHIAKLKRLTLYPFPNVSALYKLPLVYHFHGDNFTEHTFLTAFSFCQKTELKNSQSNVSKKGFLSHGLINLLLKALYYFQVIYKITSL